MGAEGASAVRRAIAQRARRGEAALRRALVAHGDWLVAATAAQLLGHEGATAQLAYFGADATPPPGELWLFTDVDAATQVAAHGVALGPYVAQVHGVDVFGRVAPSFERVRINPEHDPSSSCHFEREGIEWLRVAAAEHVIEGALSVAGAQLLASVARRLREYPAFLVLRRGDGSLLARPTPQLGDASAALAFSAEDCLEAFVATLAPEEAADLDIGRTPGLALFREVALSDLGGLLFNPSGPGPTSMLSRAVARTIAG